MAALSPQPKRGSFVKIGTTDLSTITLQPKRGSFVKTGFYQRGIGIYRDGAIHLS